MTCAVRLFQDDPPHGAPPLWMLPLILLLAIARFAQQLAGLKQQGRSRKLPTDWQAHHGGLRQSEWHLRQLVANGARQLLETGALNLNAIPMIVDVPGGFTCPMPASAFAMHLRFIAIARFHADPERYIRRHAERIRVRELAPESPNQDRREALPPQSAAKPRVRAKRRRRVTSADLWTLRVRAPP